MNGKKSFSLDLRQLEYFVAIADVGTVSGAAGRLGISQPSLSEVVARLEKQLGVSLVLRSARGAQMTEAGAALATHSRNILRNVNAALEEVRHLGGEARGPVTVGFTPSISQLLSVPLAETVQVELPWVKLRIVEGMSGHLPEWLTSERIDIAILSQTQESRDIDTKPLLEEELFLVSAPDNWPPVSRADAAGQTIAFSDVAGLPLVLPSREHGFRELVERYARANSVLLDVVTEMDSMSHIIKLVSRASAYTILPHGAVMNEVAKGELILVPIVKPVMRRVAILARKRHRPVTRASLAVEQLFSVILRESIRRFNLRAKLGQDTAAGTQS